MNLLLDIVTYTCKFGLDLICEVDVDEFKKIPKTGPAIIYANHSGTIEAPIVYSNLYPRKITGFGKAELWKKPFFNWLFTLWGIIPVNRGEMDTAALKEAYKKLDEGYFFGLTPEGTRSKDNQGLLPAKAGIVMLALRNNPLIIPIAHVGGTHFGTNIKKLKRTKITTRVGKSFRLKTSMGRVSKEIRQQMADEMMYQVAILLPEQLRGAYSDMSKMTEDYLVFEN